jgi:hypothetical protein
MAKPKILLNKDVFFKRVKEIRDLGFFTETEYKFILHMIENYDTMALNAKRYLMLRKQLTKGEHFSDRTIDRIADKEV